MTLVKFEPHRGFERISRRWEQFANDFEKGISFETGGFNPRVDITEDEKNLYVHAELPGMSKEQVKVSVDEERTLTIKGEKTKELKTENKNDLKLERSYGSFSRSFLLPENINIEKIDAKYQDGVLELVLQKIEPEKPKVIDVAIN
ncbi:MAG: Hsp20/alpha crystallin family protein [FCB group bacterium]|jgi:HSP20 family protein